MRIEEITESLLTTTPRELVKVREWLQANNFDVESTKPHYEDWRVRDNKLDLGFMAIYDGKKPVLKNDFVIVGIQTSAYSNRKVFSVRFKMHEGYELHDADEVIDLIRKYYKII